MIFKLQTLDYDYTASEAKKLRKLCFKPKLKKTQLKGSSEDYTHELDAGAESEIELKTAKDIVGFAVEMGSPVMVTKDDDGNAVLIIADTYR